MSKAKRSQLRPSISSPDRTFNPATVLVHALAAMGDERWDEAIATLQRFLEIEDRPENHLVPIKI